ncbi:hypothetical protein [Nocardioides rubriscoriae]|uniref:hypothetical protein n=1 Tax=Nocardioides rubriscoriae TaxID=642762 RepID=UPI0011DF76A8|nr:hypothetical protein [Nocardioides rubriscoriae]
MSSRVVSRVLLSVLAGALCGVVVTCGVLVVRSPDAAPPAPSARPADGRATPVATPPAARARQVLRHWDAERARAWTSGDVRALAGLYTPGSVAGRRDAAMLRAWAGRGLRVTGLTTQVLRLQVLLDRPRRLVLVVTDRVAHVSAGDLVLPHDRPSTRRIVLARSPVGRWRVASVSPEPRGRS